ncbi:hypothetical protein ATL40_1431 [Serinibacter salmoneus]|uniref:Uncharacterized protein n=1 Tax=Serinibacter salmoneus TaxID=556530 RepID=A0A2A9D0R9_9MICO|nr:hypothetical protein ATL40_1431 [Serinibacter salmoneus]
MGWSGEEFVYSTGSGLTSADEDLLGSVRQHLDYLEEVWPDVVELRVPSNRARGVGRRHRSDHAVEAARVRAVAEAVERAAPGAVVPPGVRPVPVDVGALDLMAQIAGAAEWACSSVVQAAGVEQLDPVGSVYVDPRPYLRRARAWLTGAHEAEPEFLLGNLDSILAPVVMSTAAFLGDILDGQVLDAVCPWCGGRTASAPVGGQRTLRVVCPGGRLRGDGERDDRPPMVVCFGENCEPGPREVGMVFGGRPAWPEREWDWLSKQLREVARV